MASAFTTPSICSPLVTKVVGWVEEHLQNLEVPSSDDTVTYLEWLAQNDKHFNKVKCSEQQEEDDNDINDDLEDDENEVTGTSSMKNAAMKLNAAAIFCYLDNPKKAKERISHLNNLEGLQISEKNLEVIRFLRDSLKRLLGMEVPSSSLKSLTKQDLGKKQLTAMYKFMEGYLGIVMGIPETKVLAIFLEAIDDDPECHVWYHYAYRTQRRIRRNIDRSINNRLDHPSDKEQDLAIKCHQKGPWDFKAVGDLAMLLKENLWTRSETFWNANQDGYNKSVRLFR